MAMISRLFTRKKVLDELNWRHQIHQVAEWFKQPIGQEWLTKEFCQLEPELKTERRAGPSCVLHYGPIPPTSFAPLGRVDIIRLGPPELSGLDIHCDELAWPVLEHEASIVVLQHALEFSRSPHELLKEASHSLRPGGHLIIIGVNPWSLWGMECLLSRSVLKQAQCLSPAFLKRQLGALGFILEPRHQAYLPQDNQVKNLSPTQVQGGFYILVARKLMAGISPCYRERRMGFSGRMIPLAIRATRRIWRLLSKTRIS